MTEINTPHGTPDAPLAGTEGEPARTETVLIFGQGPVIDSKTRDRALDAASEPGTEDINVWSQDAAIAAALLASQNPSLHFIVMGGQTGGEPYASEALLISKRMQELGISPDAIDIEEESDDTIENVVNFLNRYGINSPDINDTKYSILATRFHISRVEILMTLFGVPIDRGYSAQDVILDGNGMLEANLLSIGEEESAELQTSIENRMNLSVSDSYYKKQLGTERRGVVDRVLKDQLFIRELLEYPAKWLSYVGRLENDARVEAILKQTEELYPGMLKDTYGILSTDDMGTVKRKLQEIRHEPLREHQVKRSVEQYRYKPWPKDVQRRWNILREKLRARKTSEEPR